MDAFLSDIRVIGGPIPIVVVVLAVLAAAEHGNLLNAPDVYMDKIAVGPGYPADIIDLNKTPTQNVEAVAAPAKNRVAEVAGSVHQIETSIRSVQFRMERGGHEDRIGWLHGLEASLDTWERWARGRPIADADLIDAAHCLREASTASRREGWHFLAHTVEEWGAKRGVVMTPALPAPTPSVEHDFGIDL